MQVIPLEKFLLKRQKLFKKGLTIKIIYDIIIIEREVIKMARQIDIIKCKIEFLKHLDYYIRNIIGDEEITEKWLMMGLPDGYDETDLKDIALDDELWFDCVNCFANCCKAAGVID